MIKNMVRRNKMGCLCRNENTGELFLVGVKEKVPSRFDFVCSNTKESIVNYIEKEGYKFGLVFEQLEGLGIIKSNGHHIAQEISKFVTDKAKEVIKGN
jgi:hypothetical protein